MATVLMSSLFSQEGQRESPPSPPLLLPSLLRLGWLSSPSVTVSGGALTGGGGSPLLLSASVFCSLLVSPASWDVPLSKRTNKKNTPLPLPSRHRSGARPTSARLDGAHR